MLTERTYLLALSATIGTALAGSDSLRTILQRCAEATVEHLGVAAAAIWTQKPEEHMLELQATAGIYTPLSGLYDFIQVGQGEIGLVAQECQPYVTNAISQDQRLHDKAWAQRVGVVAFAAYPLIVENRSWESWPCLPDVPLPPLRCARCFGSRASWPWGSIAVYCRCPGPLSRQRGAHE